MVGDAHAGALVQHRSRVRRDPGRPNLRQVHLIQDDLLAEARAAGHDLGPGGLGENVLTTGVDLLALPTGTRLRLGEVVLRVTGLRNPCRQIEDFSAGLLKVVVARADARPSTSEVTLGPTGGAESIDGAGITRRAGVMAVVERGGEVRPGTAVGSSCRPSRTSGSSRSRPAAVPGSAGVRVLRGSRPPGRSARATGVPRALPRTATRETATVQRSTRGSRRPCSLGDGDQCASTTVSRRR